MAGVICGGILNIILDIVFVFPLQMGIAGAAFASALGMLLQVLVGGSHFLSKKNEIGDRIDFGDVENKNVPEDFTKKYGCKKLTFLLYYNYSIRRCKGYATE